MIHLFMRVMIHTSTEQKVDEKHLLTSVPMREQNVFHVTHIPSILRLKAMEYFYTKLSDATVYNYSKQAVMSASDYTERMYYDIKIVMQLKQYCVFILHFIDVQPFINNLIF